MMEALASKVKTTFQLDSGWRGYNRQFAWIGLTLVVVCAVVLGNLVGNEHWLELGVLIAAVVAMLWPIEIALGAYAFLLPFGSIAVIGDSQSGTTFNWLFGALAAMALLGTGLLRQCLEFPPMPARIFVALLVWSLATLSWALQPQAGIAEVPTILALVLLYVLAVSWKVTKSEFEVLSRFIVAGAVIASSFVIYLFLTGVTYYNMNRATLLLSGRETNPNTLGAVLLLPLSLCIAGFIVTREWIPKISFLAFATVIGTAIFFSMSRAALIAVAFLVVMLPVRLGINRRVIVLVATLSLVVLVMPSNFFSRIYEAVQTGGAGRLDIWRAGLSLLREYFITGAGLGNFSIAYNSVAGLGHIFQGYGRGSHNMYLNVPVELGLVGTALLFAALYAHFRAAKELRLATGRLPILVVPFEAACWATLVNGFFGDSLWTKTFWFNWMLLLMSVRVAGSMRKQKPGQQPRQSRAVAD